MGARVYPTVESDPECGTSGTCSSFQCTCPTDLRATGKINIDFGTCSSAPRKLVFCQDYQHQATSQVVCSTCSVDTFSSSTVLPEFVCDPIDYGSWKYRLRVYDVTDKSATCTVTCTCDPTSGCNNCSGNVTAQVESSCAVDIACQPCCGCQTNPPTPCP